jgi:hypothetical protein
MFRSPPIDLVALRSSGANSPFFSNYCAGTLIKRSASHRFRIDLLSTYASGLDTYSSDVLESEQAHSMGCLTIYSVSMLREMFAFEIWNMR